jgi:hypothetical protein
MDTNEFGMVLQLWAKSSLHSSKQMRRREMVNIFFIG